MEDKKGLKIESNADGSYTVTIDGKDYECEDTDRMLHFLEDIEMRWEREFYKR